MGRDILDVSSKNYYVSPVARRLAYEKATGTGIYDGTWGGRLIHDKKNEEGKMAEPQYQYYVKPFAPQRRALALVDTSVSD